MAQSREKGDGRPGKTAVEDGPFGLLCRGLAEVIASAVGRHLPLAFVAGLVAAANTTSPLAPYIGMLLGTAISLLMDEEADAALEGPFDRVDIAAYAAACGWILHVVQRLAGLA